MRRILSIGSIVFILSSFSFAQQARLHIIGEPELSPTDIVAVRDERTGQFCSAIQVISDLEGFGYASDIGVVRVDFSRPGKDMVFLLPDERILEIYHSDYHQLKIILSEIGIQLQPKRVWIIKLSGEKKPTGLPILINTNTDSVAIIIDGKSRGVGQAQMVTAGKHEIQLSKTGYKTIIDTIVVDEKNKQFKFTLLVKEELVFVKGGTFQMGQPDPDIGAKGWSDDEQPVHKVTVSDFYIGKYEVTNAQFCKFLNEKGNQEEGGALWLDINDEDCLIEKQGEKYVPKSGYENHPVVEVTWYGAKAYCEWAGGRLPTEAEWEYAAKGGSKSRGHRYSGSNNIEEVAWFGGNSGGQTHAVCSKKLNELGLYDMSGNAEEWCWDWYDKEYYQYSPSKNPQGPTSGLYLYRVLRGGSWYSVASGCRYCNRYGLTPHDAGEDTGFRVVRPAQ